MEGEFALRDDPLLADDVPVGQITAHQLKANSLGLTSLKVDLLEATELLGGSTSRCALGEADVQLGNTSTSDVAGIGERDGDVVDRLPQSWVTTGHDRAVLGVSGNILLQGLSLDIGDVEGSVRKTETELVADIDVMGIEVAVVDLKLLVEPRLPVVVTGGVNSSSGRGVVVGAIKCDGVGQTTAGVDITVEEIGQRVARLLTRVVGSKDGGDVLVVSPGQGIDAGRVGDDNGVVTPGGNLFDDFVAVPVNTEVLAVSSLLGPGLQHNDADVRKAANQGKLTKFCLDDLSVVKEVLNDLGASLGSTFLDRTQRGDERRYLAGTRATSSKESSKFIVLLVQLLVGLTSIVSEYCNVARGLEGKRTLVLEENGTGSTVLADKLSVVTANIAAPLAGQVELASPALWGGEVVQVGGAGINGREVLVLTKPVVRSHDTDNHVIDAGNINSAVVDGKCDITTKV